jgi:hypothetical protein
VLTIYKDIKTILFPCMAALPGKEKNAKISL